MLFIVKNTNVYLKNSLALHANIKPVRIVENFYHFHDCKFASNVN